MTNNPPLNSIRQILASMNRPNKYDVKAKKEESTNFVYSVKDASKARQVLNKLLADPSLNEVVSVTELPTVQEV